MHTVTFKDGSKILANFIGNDLYDLEGFLLNSDLITWVE